jgi:hypothetical protein
MNLFKKFDLKVILIIALSAVVLLKQCGGGDKKDDIEIVNVGGKDYELLEHKVDTVYQEKIVEVPTYVPQYVEKLVEIPVEIPADIDSLAVIQKYYSSYKTIDTLHLKYNFAENVTNEKGIKPDSNLGFGIVTDVISQNAIQSRDIVWNYKIPTIYDTKIVKELPKTQLYWGLGSGFNSTDVVSNVNTSLILKTKKDKMFQFGVGVQNNSNTQQLSPYVGGGVYWKILGK